MIMVATCRVHTIRGPSNLFLSPECWIRAENSQLSLAPTKILIEQPVFFFNAVAGESNGLLFGGEWPAFVSSNDLMYDKHGVSTGEIEVKVSGSFGKHQRFLDLAASARKAVGGLEPSPRSITVYVGDSVTDLLAMLDADVGIVVGNSGTFERLTRAFGIAVLPLASAYEALDTGESSGEAPPGRGRCVYRVSQWAEIEVFLFGDGER